MKFATLQEEDDYLFTQYVLTLEKALAEVVAALDAK